MAIRDIGECRSFLRDLLLIVIRRFLPVKEAESDEYVPLAGSSRVGSTRPGPQQRKYMHEQCHGGREGVTGIIVSTFLGASWGIIFIGIGPCWGKNLQKHHVEKRFAYHPVETRLSRLLRCPSGGPRRKRVVWKLSVQRFVFLACRRDFQEN